MKIWKYTLKDLTTQIVRMPMKSEILDIQMQDGKPTIWAMVDPNSLEIEVKINRYGTGNEIECNDSQDEYLATLQDDGYVWHFFMNYES